MQLVPINYDLEGFLTSRSLLIFNIFDYWFFALIKIYFNIFDKLHTTFNFNIITLLYIFFPAKKLCQLC